MVNLIRYPWITLTGIICWVFLRICNKTIIIGRHNMPRQANVLIVANHQSWIDSWPITYAAFYPWLLWPWKFHLVCWHIPESRNFYRNWLISTISWLSKCLPITRGQTSQADILGLAPYLAKNTIMIFPEGTRHRGETQNHRETLYRWGHGAARLACATQATVVPIAIRGMADLWPVNKKFPKLFGNKIVIVIDPPINLESHWQAIRRNGNFDPGRDRSIVQAVSDQTKIALQTTLDQASKRFKQL